MKTSGAGRSAITAREGRRLVAYRDSVGVLTIGVGHTGRMSPPAVTAGMRITPEQCDAFLASDLAPVEAAINGLGVPLTQNQFDALASFAFNIGVAGFKGSNVASCLKHGLYTNAAEALMNWVKPAVLKERREGERKQFLTPDATTTAARPVPSAATPIINGAINPPAQPSRGPSPAPASATSATKDTTMNPITGMLGTASAFYSIISTAAPIAIKAAGNIAHNFDDIQAQAKTIVDRLAKLGVDFQHLDLNSAAGDIGAAWKAGMQIFEDVGISRETMESVVKTQQDAPATSTIGKVVDFGESLIGQLTSIGLKVAPVKAA